MQRAFLYGDLLFESMLGTQQGIPHLSRHYRRLLHGMQELRMDCTGFSEAFFKEKCMHEITLFYQNNNSSENCRVRFVVYRSGGGLYLPDSNAYNFEINVDPLKSVTVNSPLLTGIYEGQKKAPGKLSNLKTGNALIYVMAKIWAKENHLDDALILNTDNEIIEATSSNIFWKEYNQWYTPPLSSGCVAGIGRQIFMEKYHVIEKPCSVENLKVASTGILTNAISMDREFILYAE